MHTYQNLRTGQSKPIPNEVIRAIHGTEEGGFWDAFKQGQFARWAGESRESNPWDNASTRTHANCWDWYRGWDRGVTVA